MSIQAMRTVVGKAVINDAFRASLLNGRRAELLREFDLEPQELSALLAIRANSLKDFAAQVEQVASSHKADISASLSGAGRDAGGERASNPGGEWGMVSDNYPFPS